MKIIPAPSSVKIAYYAILFLLNFMLLNGCNKLDSFSEERSSEEIEATFFAPQPGLTLPVLKVMDALKKQNTLGGFIPGLAKRDGYAVWEKSQIVKSNIPTYNFNGEQNDVVEVFTPILPEEGNMVSGFFYSKQVGDSVELHLYRASDYDLFPFGKVDSSVVTAELIALKVMELDNNIFGRRKYEIADSQLYSFNRLNQQRTKRATVELTPDMEIFGRYVFYVVCFETVNCYCLKRAGNCDPDHRCLVQGCDHCYFCIDVTCTTVAIGGGSPTSPTWPPDPPLSTGGGGTTPSTGNCTPTTNCGQLRSLIIEGREPCGGCGPGPVIVVPHDLPPSKNVDDTNSGDIDDNPIGNYDQTPYDHYDLFQNWPNISNVISTADFVGWGTPGIREDCMAYAKAQIGKKGYSISNYYSTGQTIQVYTQAGGINVNAAKDAIGYLKSALTRSIPVIVGVDCKSGSSNPQTDNTTDHFIVIVGMGTDLTGNYFTFYDNASGDVSQGANSGNRLYFNPNSWYITGQSQTSYGFSTGTYTLTMVRKSK